MLVLRRIKILCISALLIVGTIPISIANDATAAANAATDAANAAAQAASAAAAAAQAAIDAANAAAAKAEAANAASANQNAGSATSSNRIKPSTPTFSLVNFSDNKININVNLGSSNSERPDKVYLVAPKLGFTAANPSEGRILGSTASWSIPIGEFLGGVEIPLEIVGEKNGTRSDSLSGSYTTPTLTSAVQLNLAPPAPTNYSSRIVGTSALITVSVGIKPESRASSIFLFSASLGIPKATALSGEIVGDKGFLELPIRSSMIGKKFPVTIYLANVKGESKALSATLTIPSAPNNQKVPTALPTAGSTKNVICVRANQNRTFQGERCPAGWTKR